MYQLHKNIIASKLHAKLRKLNDINGSQAFETCWHANCFLKCQRRETAKFLTFDTR